MRFNNRISSFLQADQQDLHETVQLRPICLLISRLPVGIFMSWIRINLLAATQSRYILSIHIIVHIYAVILFQIFKPIAD